MRNLMIGRSTALFLFLLGVASPGRSRQEMSEADERWLELEVAALIAEDERALFQELETDEERAIFKKIFWARRDPTPMTPDNELQDEYEARLRAVDRHFKGTGRRGAATDRGRVFLLLGAPAESGPASQPEMDVSYDEADTEARGVPGGDPLRPAPPRGVEAPGVPDPEGGLLAGSETRVQTWVYAPNELLGIPEGLTVRFRELGGFGYRLIRDKATEEALERVRESYIVNPQIVYPRDDRGRLVDLEAASRSDSTFTSPIWMALKETREASSDVSFRADAFFFRSSEGSVFVPILFDIDAASLSWRGEVSNATVVGLVENDRGEPVRRFEEAATLVERSGDRAVFEMPLELDPGDYTLYLGARDDQTSRLGTKILDLRVPAYTADKLQLSSVLLFREGMKTEERVSAPGRAFIIGGFHFVPKLGRHYRKTDRLSGIFIAYGYGVEDGKPDLTAQYVFLQNDVKRAQTADEPFISPGPEMSITVFDIPLGSFEPGDYTMRIQVTDRVRSEVVTEDVGFALK